MRNDLDYLNDIINCIARIESYTTEGRDIFFQTPMIQDAVNRNFEIIGEATKRLSSQFKQAYPSVPWRKIAGLRDVLIHDYGNVDSNEIWNIIERDLKGLKENLLIILQDLGESS